MDVSRTLAVSQEGELAVTNDPDGILAEFLTAVVRYNAVLGMTHIRASERLVAQRLTGRTELMAAVRHAQAFEVPFADEWWAVLRRRSDSSPEEVTLSGGELRRLIACARLMMPSAVPNAS
jgi:hypothetical protein